LFAQKAGGTATAEAGDGFRRADTDQALSHSSVSSQLFVNIVLSSPSGLPTLPGLVLLKSVRLEPPATPRAPSRVAQL